MLSSRAVTTLVPSRSRSSAWQDQGSDLARVLALSDAIFAFALTLLAVDLDVPALAVVNVWMALGLLVAGGIAFGVSVSYQRRRHQALLEP